MLDDPKALVDQINEGFTAFKAANEERLKGIDKRFDDVVTNEKLERVEASISDLTEAHDRLTETLAAKELGGENVSKEEKAYNDAFAKFFLTGDGEAEIRAAHKPGSNIRAAASVGVDTDGGYAAPIEWDRTVTDKLKEIGQMRRYASSQTVTGQGFKKLYNLRGTTSGWVGETAARPETNTSTMGEYAFSFGEIYANPSATQASLEDPEISIEDWLASEVELEFAYQEGLAFISGDGVNKPKGVLNYDATDEAALAANLRHPLGPVLETNTGVANGFNGDSLISIMVAHPEERSQGAEFYANRTTIGEVRKLKDGQGNYLWQPPFQAGQPASVLGVGIRELDGVEAISADGNIGMIYGNMAMAYRIFDRVGLQVLRDPYTNKPYVHFYTRKRVGGGLWNPEYIRYMRVGA